MSRVLCAALVLALSFPAAARKSRRATPPAAKSASLDPSHWFATHQGLIRVYQERLAQGHKPTDEAQPGAGISCEVLESHPADSLTVGSMRDACTMIVGRKTRPGTQLTYEMRPSGIFVVRAQTEGNDKAQSADRMVLPAPLKVGQAWNEPAGGGTLERRVKAAGETCKAAGRTFADCLVLQVVQRAGKKVVRKYSETYAAGVGLVEDARWELIDVKGL